jgi:hypothetical protein
MSCANCDTWSATQINVVPSLSDPSKKKSSSKAASLSTAAEDRDDGEDERVLRVEAEDEGEADRDARVDRF